MRYSRKQLISKWERERRASIIKASQMLQSIPTFKPYTSAGLSLNWEKGTTSKIMMTTSVKSQEQSYKLRWIAEALMCSMDSPKQIFPHNLEALKLRYKNNTKITEALTIIGRFI